MNRIKRGLCAVLSVMLCLSCAAAAMAAELQSDAVAMEQTLYSVQIGSTVQINARSLQELTWSSSAPDIVSVTQEGLATGKRMGQAVITATAENGAYAACTVSCGYYNGMDVSSFNGDYTDGEDNPVDWERVKNTGIDFAMIRAGYGWENYPNQNDNRFVENVQGAVQNAIPFGLYFYSYAQNVQDAQAEAAYLLRELREYIPNYTDQLTLPIAYDIEEPQFYTLDPQAVTDIVLAFCNALKAEGFETMVYINNAVANNMELDRIVQNDIGIWYALWPQEPDFSGHMTIGNTDMIPDIWQYASDGSVPGATTDIGTTDLNVIYMASSFSEKDHAPRVTSAVATGSGDVEICWSKTPGAQSYTVYRAPVTALGVADTGNATEIAHVLGSTQQYTDKTALTGETYYYYITAQVQDSLDAAYTGSLSGAAFGQQLQVTAATGTGDVDLDGVVSVKDVLLLQKSLARSAQLTQEQHLQADTNGDNTLTLDDVLLIQKMIAHSIAPL